MERGCQGISFVPQAPASEPLDSRSYLKMIHSQQTKQPMLGATDVRSSSVQGPDLECVNSIRVPCRRGVLRLSAIERQARMSPAGRDTSVAPNLHRILRNGQAPSGKSPKDAASFMSLFYVEANRASLIRAYRVSAARALIARSGLGTTAHPLFWSS